MAGNLSAAMLAELQSENKAAFGLLTMTLPGSVTMRLASVPVSSASHGQFDGKVIRWGSMPRRLSDSDHALQLSTASVQFEDTDRTFAKVVEGSGANTLRGSAITVQVASPNVAAASWFTYLSGTLDTWRMVSPLVWEVTFQSNQQQLRSPFPRTPILQGDWPSVADKGLYAEWVPLIYGIHDSRGSGDNGLIPCPYVDTVGFRYLVAHGWVTVDRVYKDGALLASGYTIDHTTVNGRLYTLVNFTSDQGLTAVITADVTGYESVGDGSGSTLTGAAALKHLLSNFVYGDYQGGNWLSATTAVDGTIFSTAQSYVIEMGFQKVSRRYGGSSQTTGINAINEFCSSLNLDGFWTCAGKIGLVANDHRVATLWYDTPRHVQWVRDEIGEDFTLDWDRTLLARRIALSFLYGSNAGQFMQTLEVRDASISEDAARTLELLWSYASLL